MYKNNIFGFLIILFFAVSCTPKKQVNRIVTVTIEPQRYFAEQLVDSLYEVNTMVPPGVSPETYDPSPVQMAKLAESDIYFRIGYIGFEMAWMDKIHQNNPKLKIFDNSKGIAFISSEEEEDIPGTETDIHIHSDAHHHIGGVDPHTWTSPKQAYIIAENMCDALIQSDKYNAEIYTSNLEKLEKKIAKTDSIVTNLLRNSTTKSFIIYHPSLTYFARDYGLTQYCIEIEGKEPNPEQLKQLIEVAKIKKIKTIFVQKEFDKKNAEIIKKETGCNLVVINPLAYDWDEEIIRIAKALSRE